MWREPSKAFFGGAFLAVSLTAAAVAAEGERVTVSVRASESPDAAIVEDIELYGSSHALVIGIDKYTAGWPRLSNAVKDAKAVAKALEENGFKVTLKTNLKAAEMVRAFEEFFIVKGEKPDARLFLWFAGHGHTEGGEGFLVPADAPRPRAKAKFRLKALSLRRVGDFVRLAESKHAFAVFDSCFGGTVFDSARSLPPAAVTRATTLPVRQFLSSGDAGQAVSDDGTFRELFLRALRGEERADANDDGYVTASEIGLFLTDRVTNLTASQQTPRYGKLRDKDYDRGDFVFALPGRELAYAKQSKEADRGNAQETAFWQTIQNSKDPAMFDAYLQQFPKGTFAPLARLKRDQLVKKRGEQEAAVSMGRSLAAGDQGSLANRKRKILSESEIRETVIGNTLNFIAPSNGKNLFVYFAEGGEVEIKVAGGASIVEKKWFFDERGLLCRTAGQKNRNHCARVRATDKSRTIFLFNKKLNYEAKLFKGRHLSN